MSKIQPSISFFAGKDMTYLYDNAVPGTQLQPQKMHSLDKHDKQFHFCLYTYLNTPAATNTVKE